jgi:hypothetical protein
LRGSKCSVWWWGGGRRGQGRRTMIWELQGEAPGRLDLIGKCKCCCIEPLPPCFHMTCTCSCCQQQVRMVGMGWGGIVLSCGNVEGVCGCIDAATEAWRLPTRGGGIPGVVVYMESLHSRPMVVWANVGRRAAIDAEYVCSACLLRRVSLTWRPA